jgi:hypothetical protein
VKNLGAKGYIGKSILRRSAPHHLTKYAIARLIDIGGTNHSPERLVTRIDYGLATGTFVMGALGLVTYFSSLEIGDFATGVLFAVFFLVSGAALSRLAGAFRKVM